MTNPAQRLKDRLLGLRVRLRRIRVEAPSSEHTPSATPDRKNRTVYYDKAMWPARDYEDKGVQPHG